MFSPSSVRSLTTEGSGVLVRLAIIEIIIYVNLAFWQELWPLESGMTTRQYREAPSKGNNYFLLSSLLEIIISFTKRSKLEVQHLQNIRGS
jgi:hypothetical protein